MSGPPHSPGPAIGGCDEAIASDVRCSRHGVSSISGSAWAGGAGLATAGRGRGKGTVSAAANELAARTIMKARTSFTEGLSPNAAGMPVPVAAAAHTCIC